MGNLVLCMLRKKILDGPVVTTDETENEDNYALPFHPAGKLVEPNFCKKRFFSFLQKLTKGDILSAVVHEVTSEEYVLHIVYKGGTLQRVDIFGLLAYMTRSKETEDYLGESLKKNEYARVVLSGGDFQLGKIYVELNEKLCKSTIKLGRIDKNDLPCYIFDETNDAACPSYDDLFLKMKVDPNVSVRIAQKMGIDPYKLTYDGKSGKVNEKSLTDTRIDFYEKKKCSMEILEKAGSFYNTQSYENALQCVESALKVWPKNAKAFELRGLINVALNSRPDKVLSDYSAALSFSADISNKTKEYVVKAILSSAKLFYLEGKYAAAQHCVLQVLKLDKRNEDAAELLTFADTLCPGRSSLQEQPLEVLEAAKESLAIALQKYSHSERKRKNLPEESSEGIENIMENSFQMKKACLSPQGYQTTC